VSIDFDAIRKLGEDLAIPYLKMSGVRLEIAEERHARMVMPLGDIHINHVGTAYAGSIFIIAEISAAFILYCMYGHKAWIPVVSRVEVDFVCPARDDLVVDVSFTEQEAEDMIRPVIERGKGRIVLPVPVTDAVGNLIAKASVVFYLFPEGAEF
jgi:acyl-coenzyme A thioesterase PaaI-like protein